MNIAANTGLFVLISIKHPATIQVTTLIPVAIKFVFLSNTVAINRAKAVEKQLKVIAIPQYEQC